MTFASAFARTARVLWVLLLVVGRQPTYAQGTLPNGKEPVVDRIMSTTVPMLERNTFSQPMPNAKVGSWFEGFLAVHLPVLDSYTSSLDSAWQRRQRHHGNAVVVSMLVNLRMTRESSAPVRTPSYMPRIRYVHGVTTRKDWQVTQWLFDGTLGHYSNGQDGCLYEGQTGDDCQFRHRLPSVICAPIAGMAVFRRTISRWVSRDVGCRSTMQTSATIACGLAP